MNLRLRAIALVLSLLASAAVSASQDTAAQAAVDAAARASSDPDSQAYLRDLQSLPNWKPGWPADTPVSPELKPQPISPAWSQLRGTTLVYDASSWIAPPMERRPDGRNFLLTSEALMITVQEVTAPVPATPGMLLAGTEKDHDNRFEDFEAAPGKSPLSAMKWPPDGACGHHRARVRGGQPVWYSHCIFLRDGQATDLGVMVPVDASADDLASVNEVLASVRPRHWSAPAAFLTHAFPDVGGKPVNLGLRLPERFQQFPTGSKRRTLYCDRDDVLQRAASLPAEPLSCIEIGGADDGGYSAATGRFKMEEDMDASGGKISGVPFTASKRMIHGYPVLEITAAKASYVMHILVIADGDRVFGMHYAEPTGAGTEGYDAIWRELLEGL